MIHCIVFLQQYQHSETETLEKAKAKDFAIAPPPCTTDYDCVSSEVRSLLLITYILLCHCIYHCK